jgi:DNA-binding transcriptional ArsR family regulator
MSIQTVQQAHLPQPEARAIELAAVLHALSDPVRLHIVRVLAAEPGGRPCGGFEVPVTKSTATHHFRVLRDAGLIVQRDEGRKRLTQLRRDDLDARFPGLLDSVLRAAG